MRGHVRSTAAWQRLRLAVIVRDEGICWVCGKPGADQADHLIPLSVRPDLALDPDNVKAAHAFCNNSRGARVNGQPPSRRSRAW